MSAFVTGREYDYKSARLEVTDGQRSWSCVITPAPYPLGHEFWDRGYQGLVRRTLREWAKAHNAPDWAIAAI